MVSMLVATRSLVWQASEFDSCQDLSVSRLPIAVSEFLSESSNFVVQKTREATYQTTMLWQHWQRLVDRRCDRASQKGTEKTYHHHP